MTLGCPTSDMVLGLKGQGQGYTVWIWTLWVPSSCHVSYVQSTDTVLTLRPTKLVHVTGLWPWFFWVWSLPCQLLLWLHFWSQIQAHTMTVQPNDMSVCIACIYVLVSSISTWEQDKASISKICCLLLIIQCFSRFSYGTLQNYYYDVVTAGEPELHTLPCLHVYLELPKNWRCLHNRQHRTVSAACVWYGMSFVCGN